MFCLASHNSPRKGFTLLEILIVIVIIAQLAAILFPVFSKVRESARRSSCQSNLRQIGLAMTQYAQDYDEYLPLVGGNVSSGHKNVFAPYIGTTPNRVFDMESSSLAPYLKSTAVFVCPTDFNGQPRKMSYAISKCVTNSTLDGYDTLYGKSLAYFDETSKWFAVGEEGYKDTGTTDDGLIDVQYWGTNRLSKLHSDGSNVLFIDGHVKWLRPETVHASGYFVGGLFATSPTASIVCLP